MASRKGRATRKLRFGNSVLEEVGRVRENHCDLIHVTLFLCFISTVYQCILFINLLFRAFELSRTFVHMFACMDCIVLVGSFACSVEILCINVHIAFRQMLCP